MWLLTVPSLMPSASTRATTPWRLRRLRAYACSLIRARGGIEVAKPLTVRCRWDLSSVSFFMVPGLGSCYLLLLGIDPDRRIVTES